MKNKLSFLLFFILIESVVIWARSSAVRTVVCQRRPRAHLNMHEQKRNNTRERKAAQIKHKSYKMNKITKYYIK